MKTLIKKIDEHFCRPFPIIGNRGGRLGLVGLPITILSAVTLPIHQVALIPLFCLGVSALLLTPYLLLMLTFVVWPFWLVGSGNELMIEEYVPIPILIVFSIAIGFGLLFWRLPRITKYSCIQPDPDQTEETT